MRGIAALHRTTLGFIVFLELLLGTVSSSPGQANIGLNFQGSSLLQSRFVPPDTMAAVGRHEIVELINGRYTVYSKSDGSLLETSTLNEFWMDAGVSPAIVAFDPRVLYDPATDRWLACAADNPGGPNSFLVAVSITSDPTVGWVGFRIDSDTDNSHWADFPTMGMNADVLVIAANMFSVTPGATRTAVLVLPKEDLMAGTVEYRTLFEDLNPGTTGFTIQPVVDQDSGSLPLVLLSSYNKPSGYLKTSTIGGTPRNPTLNTGGGFIAVASRGAPPDIDQPDSKPDVDAGDNRFAGSVVMKQLSGRAGPSLWAVHGVNIDGRAAIEWYEIDAISNTVLQSGPIADSTIAYNYPSIGVNMIGDVVIGCSGGSPTQFVSTFAFMGTTIGLSTSFSSPLLLRAGNTDYAILGGDGRNRWGDYSATMVDPVDPLSFWTIQEFVLDENVWSTQITQLTPNRIVQGDRWVLNYPAKDTVWRLHDGSLKMEDGDCEWGPICGLPPHLALVRGPIVCDRRVPRYGAALILDGNLKGFILQFSLPPLVVVTGRSTSDAPAEAEYASRRLLASPAAIGAPCNPELADTGSSVERSGTPRIDDRKRSETQPIRRAAASPRREIRPPSPPKSPLKKGTGSAQGTLKLSENAGRKVPISLYQQAAKTAKKQSGRFYETRRFSWHRQAAPKRTETDPKKPTAEPVAP